MAESGGTMHDLKRLREMRERWATDKNVLRMMAHGHSIAGAPGMDELYRTANLLNETELVLNQAILIVSAETD